MDSRERVLLALDRQQPDRVPLDIWMSQGFQAKVESELGLTKEALLDEYDADLRYIEGPRYIGPPRRAFGDGFDEDIWGVVRQSVTLDLGDGTETYKEVHVSPLASAATVDDVEDYAHWPSPDWFDYSEIESQCDAVRSRGRAVVFMGDRLNRLAQLKPAMYLRGVERILFDLTDDPELAHAVFGRIRQFYVGYAERIFQAANGKIDVLLTGDDFGSQNGPLVSPDMWMTFLGEGFASYADLAHSHGVRVMHHTCGAVRPLVPLMIDRGLDALQSLQPEAHDMDPAGLKQAFGAQLAFHGGLSIQQTIPFGKEEDIVREVQDRVDVLGAGGGYILCTAHNIQADAPVRNLLAMLRAHRDCGTY